MKKRKVKIKKKKNPSLIKIKPRPKLLKIKRAGRWCEYIEGRLPYPIECSYNKDKPVAYVYKGNKRKKTKSTPLCPSCQRSIKYDDWRLGKWDKVKEEIKKGNDLSNQPSPIQNKDENL